MAVIDNPIINSPYDVPRRHWRFDDAGGITDQLVEGRRRSESWIPVPRPRKRGGGTQTELDLHRTDERRQRNDQVDQIRQVVGLWRQRGYPHTTPTTRRLLTYWAGPQRSNPVLFAQREAVETAIYLAEVAAKDGNEGIVKVLTAQNDQYNQGLPRVALKMATGSGKTVVMAMLIAWQTLNKVASKHNRNFSSRFLVVAPGITIRDRLRVLAPSDPGNYYAQRDLVPADLWPALRRAEIVVTNFHSFLLRTTHEARGVNGDTRKLASARVDGDPFTETPPMMVARVLRVLMSGRRGDGGPLVVLNDEAHHCYAPAPTAMTEGAVSEVDLKGAEKKEAAERNKDAGVWFSGLRAVAEQKGVRVSAVYDLSATPFFLSGSGYREGLIFPWVVSDFSLLDAIESGIVKIPRVPVADDSEGEAVAYLNLWEHVGDQLPKRVSKDADFRGKDLPPTLAGALQSLYASYQRSFARWEASRTDDSHRAGSTPPVFIVVCPNTVVSRWVYDTIAGWSRQVDGPDGEPVQHHAAGLLPLLSNVVDGRVLAKPRTILVDSAQLESGEALTADFRSAAAEEISAFRAEYAARTGRLPDELDDADLLREVLNTVGKPGRLGEGVRCVVSVSMLSEGWDANTVTHVLGVRAFGSQLLCEQVVGRGLRRRSYVPNDQGMFEPEYAEVYGVPFSFIPSDRPVKDPTPGRPPVQVRALVDRRAARITFPRLDGYRIEVPDHRLYADVQTMPVHRVTQADVATQTEMSGVIGPVEVHDLGRLVHERERTVAFHLARRLLDRFADEHGATKPWLFPQLVRIAEEWLGSRVEYGPGTYPGLFLVGTRLSQTAEQLFHGINDQQGGREPRVLPVFSALGRTGSTDVVDFATTKRVLETDSAKCHVDGVVLDGPEGNTWEQIASQALEAIPDVAAYVKNDHLEFAIPYVHKGAPRRYLPDFLVRLTPSEDGVPRHLVVEVSGGRKSQEARREKAETARNLWCAAVNNDGSFGRWGYVEISDPVLTKPLLVDAIHKLRHDQPITGLPSVLDGLFADHADDEELFHAAAH